MSLEILIVKIVEIFSVVLGLWYRKSLRTDIRLAVLWVFLSLTFDTVGRLWLAFHDSNHVIIDIYFLFEIAILSVLFYRSGIHKYIAAGVALLISVGVLWTLFYDVSFYISGLVDGLWSILVAAGALYVLYRETRREDVIPLLQNSTVWLFSGILLYFGGNFIYFLVNGLILKYNIEIGFNYWVIHSINYILLEIFILFSILVASRKASLSY